MLFIKHYIDLYITSNWGFFGQSPHGHGTTDSFILRTLMQHRPTGLRQPD